MLEQEAVQNKGKGGGVYLRDFSWKTWRRWSEKETASPDLKGKLIGKFIFRQEGSRGRWEWWWSWRRKERVRESNGSGGREKTGPGEFIRKKKKMGCWVDIICHVESYMAVIILKLAVCSRDNYYTQFGSMEMGQTAIRVAWVKWWVVLTFLH